MYVFYSKACRRTKYKENELEVEVRCNEEGLGDCLMQLLWSGSLWNYVQPFPRYIEL